jgi:hypothetical protein
LDTSHDKSKEDGIVYLVCGGDMKLYNGDVDGVGQCFGCLKENANEAFARLCDAIHSNRIEYRCSPSFYYPGADILSLQEAAKNYGDANGQKIYSDGIYYKWLDRAFSETA